jgi:hypothetical protein
MNERIVIDLVNLLVSEPKVIEVEGKLINLEGFFFMEGIVKRIVVENDGGLRQISVYSDNKKIAKYPFLNKRECIIESVTEDGNEIVVIKVK